MSASTVPCHVLGGDVAIVTDMNGIVVNVICPMFIRPSHGCGKKFRASGFLELTLKKAIDIATGETRMGHCEFVDLSGPVEP